MDAAQSLTLRSIGRVIHGRPKGIDGDHWESGQAQIEIDEEWLDALDGVDGFSHLWVVWGFDRRADPGPLKVHPQRRQDLPLVGLFATRSPSRPNPIAITAVRLLTVQGTRLIVEGLDAYEGSIVFDIKPYLRRGDCCPESTVPDWIDRLWETPANSS